MLEKMMLELDRLNKVHADAVERVEDSPFGPHLEDALEELRMISEELSDTEQQIFDACTKDAKALFM